MTDRELMQQALEALERERHEPGTWLIQQAAITALRERLAQPEQREVEIEFTQWLHPQMGVVPVDPKTPLILKAKLKENT